MLSSSRAKIHEPIVTGVSPRPTDQRQRQKLRNTRVSKVSRTARSFGHRHEQLDVLRCGRPTQQQEQPEDLPED